MENGKRNGKRKLTGSWKSEFWIRNLKFRLGSEKEARSCVSARRLETGDFEI
jgi:hypothetical protein